MWSTCVAVWCSTTFTMNHEGHFLRSSRVVLRTLKLSSRVNSVDLFSCFDNRNETSLLNLAVALRSQRGNQLFYKGHIAETFWRFGLYRSQEKQILPNLRCYELASLVFVLWIWKWCLEIFELTFCLPNFPRLSWNLQTTDYYTIGHLWILWCPLNSVLSKRKGNDI